MARATAEFEDVECVAETDDAICCNIEGKEIWFPKTHVDADSEVYEKGGEGTLIVTQWIAEQKGLV